MAPYFGNGNWQPIAEQASKEMDPAKLTILIEKLCRALEGERREKSRLTADCPGAEPRSPFGN